MKWAWTDQHREFCVRHKFPASAIFLWQWILGTQVENNLEVEFNLKTFNVWVEQQRGKPLDVKTVKSAAGRLLGSEAFKELKCDGFKWNWKRWIVMPLTPPSRPIQQGKSSVGGGEVDNLQPSNPHSADEEDIAAAASNQVCDTQSEVLETCEKAGIPFRPEEAGNLLRNSIEQVQKAIAHFQKRGGHDKIANPQGWLIECLRRHWWEDDDEYYSIHNQIARNRWEAWALQGCPIG